MLKLTSPVNCKSESIQIDHTLSIKLNEMSTSHHWFYFRARGLLEIGLSGRDGSPEDVTLVVLDKDQVYNGIPYDVLNLHAMRIRGLPSFSVDERIKTPSYTHFHEDFTVWIAGTQIAIVIGSVTQLHMLYQCQRVQFGIGLDGMLRLIHIDPLSEAELQAFQWIVDKQSV